MEMCSLATDFNVYAESCSSSDRFGETPKPFTGTFQHFIEAPNVLRGK